MYSLHELIAMSERELAQLPYPARPAGLYEPIRYALGAGGKRIRPALVLMACNLFQEAVTAAKPAALAVEVFHNFTLLHDDIMDNADTRRGKPSVHKKWNDNTAILSGDAMLIYAYRLLAGCDEKSLPRLLTVFNEVAVGVCEGQQYEMDFEKRTDVSVAEYLRMIELKTAVLLAGALKLGAICGGGSDMATDLLYKYGISIGLAFQLQDDLLDTYADSDEFGKPVGGDILEGKKTFLLTNALARADEPARRSLLELLSDRTIVPAEKIARVRAIYDRLGIRELTEKAVAAYFADANLALDALEVAPDRLKPLRELTAELQGRRK